MSYALKERLRPLQQIELKQINKELHLDTVLGVDAFCLELAECWISHRQLNRFSGDLSSIAITLIKNLRYWKSWRGHRCAYFWVKKNHHQFFCPYQCYLSFPPELLAKGKEFFWPIVSYPNAAIHGRRTSTSNRRGPNLRSSASSQHGRGVAGICIDFDSLPALNDEEFRRLFVILRTLFGLELPILVYMNRSYTSPSQGASSQSPGCCFSNWRWNGIPEAATCRLLDDLSKPILNRPRPLPHWNLVHLWCTWTSLLVVLRNLSSPSHLFLKRKIRPFARPSTWYERILRIWRGIHRSSSTHTFGIGLWCAISGLRMVGCERLLPHYLQNEVKQCQQFP